MTPVANLFLSTKPARACVSVGLVLSFPNLPMSDCLYCSQREYKETNNKETTHLGEGSMQEKKPPSTPIYTIIVSLAGLCPLLISASIVTVL